MYFFISHQSLLIRRMPVKAWEGHPVVVEKNWFWDNNGGQRWTWFPTVPVVIPCGTRIPPQSCLVGASLTGTLRQSKHTYSFERPKVLLWRQKVRQRWWHGVISCWVSSFCSANPGVRPSKGFRLQQDALILRMPASTVSLFSSATMKESLKLTLVDYLTQGTSII